MPFSSDKTFTIKWRDYLIEVSFRRDPYNLVKIYDKRLDHIGIKCLEPDCHPLPVTSTGYRSHFIREDDIEQYESVEDFVIQWLDHEAKKAEWAKMEIKARQGNLFD